MFYRGQPVLVTGGTGFVGIHLVQELLRHEADVRVASHLRPLPLPDLPVDLVTGDLCRLDDCLAALRGIRYVFHAAGPVGAAGVGPSAAMSGIATNLALTTRMLEAAWNAGVERFLLFSSSTGYPAFDHPVREEEFWAGDPHPAYFGYGWMRRYLERAGEFVASRSAMKVSIVRPTAVYGRFDNFDPQTGHVIPSLIRKAVERLRPFEVWGTGEEVRDFLHITDLARGALMMLERKADCDPVNIGCGEAVTIGRVVEIILEGAGFDDAEVVFNPSRPTAIPFRAVDTSKAQRTLGFRPLVTIEDGLRDTIAWYRETSGRPRR